MADDVSGGPPLFRELRPALDLVEESGRRELEHACEEVQATAVRHADYYVLHTSCEAGQFNCSGSMDIFTDLAQRTRRARQALEA